MEEYFPLPERRYPSPSAQRRSGEHWKARFGLATVVLLTLLSAGLLFRLAGVGIGVAISPFRGQAASSRPTAAATPAAGEANPSGQPPADQSAATAANPPAANPPAAAQQAAAQAPPAQPTVLSTAAPTAAAQSTPRPGQKQYVVKQGDSLFAIAQQNGTTVDALVAANNLRSRDVILSVGQTLNIP